MTTIGLCMIVKNEEHVIERCLDSVRPLVDYVLVCDTGSTDDTVMKIHNWLLNNAVGGQVLHRDWIDFGTNRSETLTELRRYAKPIRMIDDIYRDPIDYALMMDADDQLVVDQGLDIAAWKVSLTADMYDVLIEHPPVRHWRPQIFSNRREFRYRGVLHEFVEGPPGHTRGRVDGVHILAGVEGSRSRDPEKYLKDVQLLKQALYTETDELMRQRYTFYLAQSYKDAGENLAAESWYQQRAKMGGWKGEVYVSLWRVAQLMEWRKDASPESIIGTYLRAFEADPSRAEALQSATQWCHRHGHHHQGYLIGRHGITIPEPDGKLFSEPWVYEWGMHDAFSVAAYWSGHYGESLESAQMALKRAPEEHRARIEANVRFAREKGMEQRGWVFIPPSVTVSRDELEQLDAEGGSIASFLTKQVDILKERTKQVDFTVVSVELPGYVHSGAYAELAETMLHGLHALGYMAELRHDQEWGKMDGQIILIGAHVINGWPSDCIVYNTEHHVRVAESDTYGASLHRSDVTIWDYSEENSSQLSRMLGRPVKHVPVGYAPEMTRIEPVEQDIDVLFYGSTNDRRTKILRDLRDVRLSVECLFGVYGKERDAYIARAKVVLSMHYYTPGVFEAVRVGYLLTNKKVVVCEDDERGEAQDAGAYAVGYDELVDACRALVGFDAAERDAIAEEGFKTFGARSEANVLRTALRRRVWDCFLYNGEADVLAIRLHELRDVVDRFVIVEADTTFSGLKKPQCIYPLEVLDGSHRIEFIRVTNIPETTDPWERERHQRNAIVRGLADATPDDLIMISDVDEVPRASVVREMADDHQNTAFGLRLAFHYFLLNYRCTSGPEANRVWNCAVTKRLLDTSTPDTMRYLVQNISHIVDGGMMNTPNIIDDSGWHFSYLGDDDAVRAKVRAFSHQEYNTSTVLDSVDVNRMVQNGEDLFGRPGYGWRLVGTDDLPEWVKSQPKMMERWTR